MTALLDDFIGVDDQELALRFDAWMQEANRRGQWSPENPRGWLIPWRRCNEAFSHSSYRDIANMPGVYLFGSATNGVVYVGKTASSYRRRFRRYFGGSTGAFPKAQFHIADNFKFEISNLGIDGIPQEVVNWYRSRFAKSNDLRLRHAVELAKLDLDQIWVTLIDADSFTAPCDIEEVESRLIARIVPAWNRVHGHGKLLNIKGVVAS